LLPTLLKENEIWRGHKLLFDPEGSRLLVFRSRTGITEGLRRIRHSLGSDANSMAADLALKEESGQLLLLDANRGLPIGEPITHDSEFISSAFTRDGNQTATYDLSSIRSIDLRSGTVISEKQLESTGDFGVFDAKATSLATWSPKRNAVRIWDVTSGKEKFPPLPQSQDVQRVEFLASDGIAVTCENHIQYWDNISSDRHRAPGIILDTPESHESYLMSPRSTAHEISSYDYFGEELWPRVSRSPDNTQYYLRGSDRLTTLDAALRTPIGRAQCDFEIRNKILSRDGKYLITLSGWNQNPETECVLRVQNIASGEILGSPIHVSGGILSIAISSDASLVACTFPNKEVTVWNTSTGKLRTKPIHVNEVVDGMEFSDDNKYLVTQSMPKHELRDRNIEFNDNTFASEICLWETKSGKQLARIFDNNLSEFSKEKRAFSSDGKYLAVLSKNHLAHLIHTATGKEVCRTGNDNAIVRAFAFSPNGEYWVTVGSVVEIRRTMDGELVAELVDKARNYTAVAFAPDGASFAIGGRWSVQLIEAPSCRPLGVSTRHGDQVTELRFFADGSRLSVGALRTRTGLFDSYTMELVEQLDFWESSLDGRRLVGTHESILVERGLECLKASIWDASRVLRIGSDFEISDLEWPKSFEFDESGSRLAMQSHKSLTIWDIRPPVLPTSDATKQAFFELLSRYKVSENGRTEPLSDADREARYRIVKEDTPFWNANLTMLTERKRRWHTSECNQAIQHRDIASAEFHLRWLRTLTSEEELASTIEPLRGKVDNLKERFAQFQEDLESAEVAASSADWTEVSSLLRRALAFLEKEPSEKYRRVAHMLIASLVMRADHDSRQQARQLLFQPDVLSPDEPSWKLLFACWLFQSTANERQLAADEARAWYRDSGIDEQEYPNWIVAWASALDDNSETAIAVLEIYVANLWFDEGDLLFLASALMQSEDRAGSLAKTQLCREKFHKQWGDAATIQRRPWHERVCLEMFREYLDQLEKTLD
jgi:WD40 repeat protein